MKTLKLTDMQKLVTLLAVKNKILDTQLKIQRVERATRKRSGHEQELRVHKSDLETLEEVLKLLKS